jgi:CheY-like chemotaxis protein
VPQTDRPRRHPGALPSRSHGEQPERRGRGSGGRRAGSAARGQSRPPTSQSPRRSGRGTRPTETESGRILLVDDEAAIRLICRINLQFEGFETLEAEDGESALALAERDAPDLILLDVMIPSPDGWKVAEELARRPATRDIPIVFLTARADPVDERRAYELGGLGYVRKPFEPDDVAALVARVLEHVRRGERDALRAEWLAAIERKTPGP